MRSPLIRILPAFGRLCGDKRGNVLMTLALSIIPLMLATGAAIDYSRAARLQTKLNAAADAAALAAVTQPMMLKSDSEAKAAAINMFNEQAKGLPGLIYNPADLTVTISTVSGASNDRTATVAYTAKSQNAFAGLLKMNTITIGGSSQANARIAPNIDFYVLLDTSGSMALPATSAGLTLLTSKTGGCAFACHSTNDATAKDKNGKTTDYYGVATSYGISLRSDEAKKAIQSMMSLATSTAATNSAQYRAALASFAAASPLANNSYKVLQSLTSNLSQVSTAAGSAPMSLYYKNNCPTASFCNNDADTASSDAFDRLNQLMPAPGNGTNNPGDKPQEIMFVITDGMRDESRPGGKPEVAFDTTWCNTVKGRGIRIAILYTEYLPESLSDSWSKTNVLPNLYKVEPALKSCASENLFYKVTTDDDISAALNKLFLTAVATARLVQ
jgi:Flp pilus assembly protein TadG